MKIMIFTRHVKAFLWLKRLWFKKSFYILDLVCLSSLIPKQYTYSKYKKSEIVFYAEIIEY